MGLGRASDFVRRRARCRLLPEPSGRQDGGDEHPRFSLQRAHQGACFGNRRAPRMRHGMRKKGPQDDTFDSTLILEDIIPSWPDLMKIAMNALMRWSHPARTSFKSNLRRRFCLALGQV